MYWFWYQENHRKWCLEWLHHKISNRMNVFCYGCTPIFRLTTHNSRLARKQKEEKKKSSIWFFNPVSNNETSHQYKSQVMVGWLVRVSLINFSFKWYPIYWCNFFFLLIYSILNETIWDRGPKTEVWGTLCKLRI